MKSFLVAMVHPLSVQKPLPAAGFSMTTYQRIGLVIAAVTVFCGSGVLFCIWKAAVYYNQAEMEKARSLQKDEIIRQQDARLAEYARREHVVVRDGLLYIETDPPPFYPLCGPCYAEDKIIRMIRYDTTVIDEHVETIRQAQSIGVAMNTAAIGARKYSGFMCSRCRTKMYVYGDSQRQMAKYGHSF